MSAPRRGPVPAGGPVVGLQSLADALCALGWTAQVIIWPGKPACVLVENPGQIPPSVVPGQLAEAELLPPPPGRGGTAGTMTPGRALAALRTALAADGQQVDGMTISRLQGVLIPASGPPVRYACGWLIWPAGRLSHRGRSLYTVHSAADPAGAARRLIGPDSPASPGRPGKGT
jgi:hypothetical protein